MKPTTVEMKDLLIVSSDTGFSMALVAALQGAHFRIMVDNWPLSTLADVPAPDAAIVELDGSVSVVELRALVDRWPGTRFLFAIRDVPIKAALARIIRDHGGVILSKGESPAVIGATLGAMLAGKSREAP